MKKIIYLFISLIIFAGPSFALELNGGVAYDVKSARDYVQDGRVDNLKFSGHSSFQDNDSVEKVLYTYGNYGNIIGVTVQYKGEPDKAYIYGKDYNLKNIDKYDRDVRLFPHRGYRYDLNGNLILMSLTVSPKEQFRFTPAGDLLVHSINGIIYDENGNVIGNAK